MLLEDSSLWHLKVKFMPTRLLQKHCNSMVQPSPLQTHRARMRHVCKIPFNGRKDILQLVQKRPKLPKGWMHSRRQTTAGDSSCFSLQPCIQLFVLPQKLSAFLHLGLKAWKPWLLIANQQSLLSCFHAFMLSTHCTLDSSEPRMRCSFPALKIVGDVVSLSRSCSNSWSQMIQVQRPASLAFIPGAGSSILSTSLSSSGAERRLLAISKFLNAALRVSFQRRASCPLIHKMPLAHKR